MSKPATASLPQSGSVVSRWVLEESSGNATDSVGSNNLTDTNTVTASSDVPVTGFSRSRDFESGNSEYFTITHAAQSGLGITGAFTIAAWVRLESIGAAVSIASKWKNNNGELGPYAFTVSATNKLTLRVSQDTTDANSPTIAGSTSLSAATWYHVVGVYDPSTRLEVYINGATDGTNTTSIPATLTDAEASNFYLGAWNSSAGAVELFFDGLMQDAIIWNTDLTDNEVNSLYNLYPSTETTNAYSFFM